MAALALVLLASLELAPPPSIERPAVDVVQRGKTTEIALIGDHLAQAERVLCLGPRGMTARILQRKRRSLRVALDVAAGAELGDRMVRVVTPTGVSRPQPIHVSSLRVVRDDSLRGGSLPLPSMLCGIVERPATTDRFRFRADPGHEIVFDLSARRIDSALDPHVTILDRHGQAIAWGEPGKKGDPLLVFRARKSAVYELAVRDLRHRGGAAYRYRIRAGRVPHVTSLFPLAAPRGDKVRFAITGHNVPESIELAVPAERSTSHPLMVETGAGTSNALPIAVTDHADTIAREQADAQPLALPASVSGRIDAPGDRDSFSFSVERRSKLVLTARAKRYGSPLDALLLVTDANGRRIKADDDGERPDAKITHDFRPGKYRVTVRDVAGRGGEAYTYRLRIRTARTEAPSYSLRLLPDSVRVYRGSHAKLWCELVRTGAFRGGVGVAPAALPPGIRCTKARLGPNNNWTSVFTIAATANCPRGTHAISFVTPNGESRTAWVTVLGDAPFTVTPIGRSTKDTNRYREERRKLREALAANEGLATEQAAWERRATRSPHWIVLDNARVQARDGTRFRSLDDGSHLTVGKAPVSDVYTLRSSLPLRRVSSIRLEVLPHESLPHGGPGRHGINGNFVLSQIRAALLDAEGKATKLPIAKARASYSQAGFEVVRSLDGSAGSGWAIVPRTRVASWAILELAKPIAVAGRELRLELGQQYGTQHLIGRFRISIAAQPLLADHAAIPESVYAALLVERRDAGRANAVAAFYRKVSPRLQSIRDRITEIDNGRGNQPEINAMFDRLTTPTPELQKAQRAWEARTAKSLTQWTPLVFDVMRSQNGVRFVKEPNHVSRVRSVPRKKDNYTLIAKTTVRGITAIRLEALPHEDLPGNGPGFAPNGNFVLSDISISAWPSSEPTRAAPVRLHRPQASFEQRGFPIARTLDGSHRTGWGVLGNTGKASYAMWRTRQPVDHGQSSTLRVYLEHQSPHPKHLLACFRVSVTASKNPRLGTDGLPIEIAQILVTPRGARTPRQRGRLAAYYTWTCPELAPVRDRLSRLWAEQTALPPSTRRTRRVTLAAQVQRRPGFEGPVRVTVEGYSSGRDRAGKPNPLAKNIETKPVRLLAGESIALVTLKPKPKSELGSRAVVLRAEATIGGERVVQYSAPVLLSVAK